MMNDNPIRCFVAFDFSPEAKAFIHSIIEKIKLVYPKLDGCNLIRFMSLSNFCCIITHSSQSGKINHPKLLSTD